MIAKTLLPASIRPAETLSTWQAAALAMYRREVSEGGARLRAELAAQVRALTGRVIPSSAITVDCDGHRAGATMDGVVFQLQGHNLLLLRPCAHCGTGRFASPPLCSRTDLGYALFGWRPYHASCEPADLDDADW